MSLIRVLSPKKCVGSAVLTTTYRCQNTVIYGIMKDRSLLIHSLAPLNCFTYRNLFQNGVNDMGKIMVNSC